MKSIPVVCATNAVPHIKDAMTNEMVAVNCLESIFLSIFYKIKLYL